MGNLGFLLVLLFAQHVFADINFTPSEKLMLTGQTCEELNVYAQAIVDWNTSITKESLPLPECFCSSKSCIMDVAPISPYAVRDLTNFKGGYYASAAYPGPNCFNAALNFSHTLNHIVFTHPYEMTALLNSSLCKERKIDEPLQPGDILVVRNQSDKYFEIHAGVYVGRDLSFSKYGETPQLDYSYGFNVDRSYGVHDEECRRVEGVPDYGHPCYFKPFVNYFSCTPSYAFVSNLTKQPGGIDERVRQVYAKSSRLDSLISGIALKGDDTTVEKVAGYQKTLRELFDQTEVLLNEPSLNAGNAEFNRLLRAHIYSLFEQNRRIGMGLGSDEIKYTELPLVKVAPFLK